MITSHRLRAGLATACVVISIAAGSLPARAANTTCAQAEQLKEAFVSTGLPMHPLAGAAQGTVGDNQSKWYYGVFQEATITPSGPATLTVYDYGAGCTKPRRVCTVDSDGPTGRCLVAGEIARRYIEVHHRTSGAINFAIGTATHCLRPPQSEGCRP